MQFGIRQSRFHDRSDAGRRLASALASCAERPDVLVFALPRGGVPVAYEVAQALDAPLDVFLVRKLGVPGHEELAIGALASGGIRILNEDIVTTLGLDEETIDRIAAREEQVLKQREMLYRGTRPPPQVKGRVLILVDDGLATGATMRAAVTALRQQSPARIVVAVPVAPIDTCEAIREEVDDLVCLLTPAFFHGVSAWYDDFSQTSDEEVRALLAKSRGQSPQREQKPRGAD